MTTSSFPSREKLLAYSAQSTSLAWQAKREGRPVAWMSTKFPAELPAAFGLVVCCPESRAAVLGATGASPPLCEQAHNLGWCADLCSYSRIGLALAAGRHAPGSGLPLPDLLLCCTNICSQMLQWYQNMARILNVPLLLFDIPYTAQDAPSPSLLRYLKGQFFHLAHQLEELTGTPWRQEAFDAACGNALASGKSWERLCALLEAPLCPWDGMELFDYMPVLVNRRCETATARLLDELADELAALPPASRPPAARLMLEGSPCWPHMGQILEPLRKAGVKICADTITPSLSFSYTDLDGLLAAYCSTINGSTLPVGFESRRALCRARGVDGVLIHYNRSCRPWCGTLPQLGRMLAAQGWAVASFDGDQADPSAFSPQQYAARVQGLLEMLSARPAP